MNAPLRVIYIAGTGRSGTTLIANALGSVDGARSWGELRYVWERGVLQRRWCGCGQPVPDCPVWHEVFDKAGFGRGPRLDEMARSVTARMEPILRTRSASTPVVRPKQRPEGVLEPLGRLYEAIGAVGDGDVIVDSSKLPVYGWLLGGLDVDLRIVSVVRDPRAVAFSWSQVKDLPDDVTGRGRMAQLSPARSSAVWLSQNMLTAALLRRMGAAVLHVRYEDFTAEPTETLRRLADFAGLEPERLPIEAGGIRLRPSHTVAGNPDRFERHDVTPIRADARWSGSMSTRDRWLVTALTAPALPVHRYRVRPT